MHRYLFPVAWLLLLLGTGCSTPPDETGATSPPAQTDSASESTPSESAIAEKAPSVAVTTLSYPVDWLVARLASDSVMQSLAIPAGESPVSWRPTAEAIVEMQGADLIVMNGAGYEKWTEQASLPLSRLLDTSTDLELIKVVSRTHSHGPGGEHSHVGNDPHLWMDPDLYLAQARRIDEALEALGVSKGALGALAELDAELRQLISDTEEAVAPLRGVPMAASHPSFAYFARRFGLEIKEIDLDPQAPDAKQVAAFEAWASGLASDQGPAIVWWIEEPSDAARAALPEGTRHLVFDSLEQPAGEDYDYLAQARVNIERLRDLAGEG